jgi:CheY-like chemotaxis protein
MANRARRVNPPVQKLEELAERAEQAFQQGQPTQELVAAWVHFLRDHVTDAANGLNNRLNAIALQAQTIKSGRLTKEQSEALERMRTEVGWATNITGALVHRVSSKSPEIPPPQWNILQDALGEPARVLIVEPDESNRSAIVNLLRGVGHEVTAVSNGHQAWDLLSREPVDCVLSDVRMAAMAGKTLFEQVEEKMPHVARRFVFVTGDYARPESYQFLVESRQPVVGKPYEVETLVAAIATVLQQAGRYRASGEVELEQ